MIAGNCMAIRPLLRDPSVLTMLRSNVFGRSRESSEACGIMRLAGAAGNGSQDGFTART